LPKELTLGKRLARSGIKEQSARVVEVDYGKDGSLHRHTYHQTVTTETFIPVTDRKIE
jgi:hypothetical protein